MTQGRVEGADHYRKHLPSPLPVLRTPIPSYCAGCSWEAVGRPRRGIRCVLPIPDNDLFHYVRGRPVGTNRPQLRSLGVFSTLMRDDPYVAAFS